MCLLFSCNCHGHGAQCTLLPGIPYQCTCARVSYTEGRQCDQCVAGTYKDPAKHAYDPELCQQCACSQVGTEDGQLQSCDPVSSHSDSHVTR